MEEKVCSSIIEIDFLVGGYVLIIEAIFQILCCRLADGDVYLEDGRWLRLERGGLDTVTSRHSLTR